MPGSARGGAISSETRGRQAWPGRAWPSCRSAASVRQYAVSCGWSQQRRACSTASPAAPSARSRAARRRRTSAAAGPAQHSQSSRPRSKTTGCTVLLLFDRFNPNCLCSSTRTPCCFRSAARSTEAIHRKGCCKHSRPTERAPLDFQWSVSLTCISCVHRASQPAHPDT